MSDICIVSTLRASKPGSTLRRAPNVRISKAAPTSSTSANAISVTTRIDRALFCRNPLPARKPLSLSVAFRSVRDALNAGISPNKAPVNTETPSVNTNTRQSSVMPDPCSPIRGILPGLIESSPRTPKYPRPRPSRPPASDNKTLSVSSCRIRRPRPAPIAARMAISRCRMVARASRRFATLAQAMRSTRLTAPSKTSSAFRTSPTIVSLSGSAVKLPCGPNRAPAAAANFRLNCSAATFIAAFAFSSVTPGFNRAAARK